MTALALDPVSVAERVVADLRGGAYRPESPRLPSDRWRLSVPETLALLAQPKRAGEQQAHRSILAHLRHRLDLLESRDAHTLAMLLHAARAARPTRPTLAAEIDGYIAHHWPGYREGLSPRAATRRYDLLARELRGVA